MQTWSSLALGDGVDALTPTQKIMEAWMPVFIAAGQPRGMAVFSNYDLEANVVTAYFPPESFQLGVAFGALPCEKPSISRIGLLVGEADAHSIHFPR